MSAPPSVFRKRVLPATAAAAAVAVLAGGTWYLFDAACSQPIRHVLFAGDVQRLARADLEAFARSVQGAPAGGASLGAVREAARRIPWVRDATVRRTFPDAVEVTFETHQALARWADGALVSERGEVFSADYDGKLPRFNGPEGSAAAMAREYPAIARALAPLQASVAEVVLSPRGAWQVLLDLSANRPLPSSPGGALRLASTGEGELLALQLGRGDIHPRLARFVAAWPVVAAPDADTKHADLRYANGFALRRQ